jgi:hypothetical protein
MTQARMIVTKHNGAKHPALSINAEVHDNEPVLICWTGKNLMKIPIASVLSIDCIILRDDGN